MKTLMRYVIILDLIEELRACESWCGETHVQKATYFLQQLAHVPLEYKFVLYKHGPFSFDLSDELTAMRADEIIQLESNRPYGPKIKKGQNAEVLRKMFPKTRKKYQPGIQFIAKELGRFDVKNLERLATALYVREKLQKAEDDITERANRINKLKPHISVHQALAAIAQETEIWEKACARE